MNFGPPLFIGTYIFIPCVFYLLSGWMKLTSQELFLEQRKNIIATLDFLKTSVI